MSDKVKVWLGEPPEGPCDECGQSAFRWFGHTSIRLCKDPRCWDTQYKKYQQALKDMDADEKYAEEMFGWKK